MARKALAVPFTYGRVQDGHDAYLPSMRLRPLAEKTGRYWAFYGTPTTVALPGNTFAKSIDAFQDHMDDEPAFRELLLEYADNGVPRPTGYADVFHEHFYSPRIPWSVNCQLAPAFAGGWQAALKPGPHRGTFYKYDLRSAYLWAATLGLPDPATYQRSLSPVKCKHDGLYRIKLIEPSPNAPFPFNQAYECIATKHEIEVYGLRVSEILDGVSWSGTLDGASIVASIRRVSTWKQAARSYWGRWAQLQKVTCVAGERTWRLPNMALNIPWAHEIVSRVKMRMWTYSGNAVHVFVDSLITPEWLPTGLAVGDFRLENTYRDGVFVRGPGQYGALHASKLERMAGVSRDSAHRNNPVVAPCAVPGWETL